MACNNKYMYTKENWNPNVYNIDIEYQDIPSNRRELFTDEILEVAEHTMPASQKIFVEFKTKSFTKDSNTLKLNTNIERVNLREIIKYNVNQLNKKTYQVSLKKEDPINITIIKYTLNINLDDVKLIKIKRKGNLKINTKLTNYKIIQNNNELKIKQSMDKTTKVDYMISTGKDKDIYLEDNFGKAELKIETTNEDYIKEIILYNVI